ncbi:DNA-3-methyladenine glycosylase [Nocardioides sp. 1609]|uniref:DNA-3-methyladenine glycosylase n=1 Tax=Nocardioides sp. 1609 TaxID=2508327 RepID=UPI00106F68E6|nr:DNA-3-methyladenine glycosylase [Nocardioides sp. 1609]
MSDWPDLLGPAEEVAPRLLGAVLRLGDVAVRLTEVEAYAGTADPGSHAFRGPTPRTRIMFGPAGSLYCYLSYGMHVCANVVVGEEGTAAAVLLRAGEVVAGHDAVADRRPGVAGRDLARGPALLCRALGIGLAHDGTDLRRGPVTLEMGEPAAAHERGPRTGLRRAPDRPWRFWVPGDPTVSAYRRHPRAVVEPGTTG